MSNAAAPMRIGVFLTLLLLIWLPLTLPIGWFVKDANLVSILTLILLYVVFLLLLPQWGRRVHRQPHLIWWYGLELSRRSGRELAIGLAIGAVSLFGLFALQAILGWLVWQAPAIGLVKIALEGLLMALAVGFAEELLFRGWLLDELRRDYRPPVAMLTSAIVYAAVHGFRPQFGALVILGCALVWAKQIGYEITGFGRRNRLALPIGLHAGLVWGYYLINVGQLIQYTDRVPAWVTGLDRNPLAGAIGVLFLFALALGLRCFAQSGKPQQD